MNGHWVYGTSTHGTVHLISSEDTVRFPNPAPICGSRDRYGHLEQGDETTSGVAATCRRCLRIARPDLVNTRRAADHS